MAIKIAEYTFNSSTNTLPTFNSGYTYEYTNVNNGNGTITRTITSESSPTSISFKDKRGLVSLSYLDTSNVTSMSEMFDNCENLTSLDLSNFNTSKVTDMALMFSFCTNLTSLDLSSFDTSNVTDMNRLFFNCHNLTSIKGLNHFDTSNVTDMTSMFLSCSELTSLDLSSFDTSNVTKIGSIFQWCDNLTTINMNNSNVDSINDIIAQLPTRTSDSYGTMAVSEAVLNSVDIITANSKYWNIKVLKYTFTLDTLKYLLTNIKNKFVTKEEMNNKVDKVEGKQLSVNNFSDEDINNINNSFDDAEVNQSGMIMSFYSTSVDGVKTKIKDINLDI